MQVSGLRVSIYLTEFLGRLREIDQRKLENDNLMEQARFTRIVASTLPICSVGLADYLLLHDQLKD